MKTLAALRKENNFTQRDLADLLDVSPGTIGLWETGKRKPTLDRAILIATLFNVSVESISFSGEKKNKDY